MVELNAILDELEAYTGHSLTQYRATDAENAQNAITKAKNGLLIHARAWCSLTGEKSLMQRIDKFMKK